MQAGKSAERARLEDEAFELSLEFERKITSLAPSIAATGQLLLLLQLFGNTWATFHSQPFHALLASARLNLLFASAIGLFSSRDDLFARRIARKQLIWRQSNCTANQIQVNKLKDVKRDVTDRRTDAGARRHWPLAAPLCGRHFCGANWWNLGLASTTTK